MLVAEGDREVEGEAGADFVVADEGEAKAEERTRGSETGGGLVGA